MDKNQISRTDKRKKRRKLSRIINVLFILAVLLIVSLIFLVTTNGFNNTGEKKTITIGQSDQQDEIADNSLFIEYVDSVDDNVIEAYIGHWEPMETSQTEPHIIDLSEQSIDRKEIIRAILHVTELEADNLVEWAIQKDEDNQVIATVSDKDEEQILRIYLSWITDEGWQVTKIEELKENDQK